ncbi:MAG: FHA domain-containing protein [Verrucomicrobia bacterium]|nr:FHA domain-containing protein [Verrucomicrobiota bacterium]
MPLRGSVQLKRYLPDQLIYPEGAVAEWACRIVSGRVRLTWNTGLGPVRVCELGKGHVFGASETVARLPRPYAASAAAFTMLELMDRERLILEMVQSETFLKACLFTAATIEARARRAVCAAAEKWSGGEATDALSASRTRKEPLLQLRIVSRYDQTGWRANPVDLPVRRFPFYIGRQLLDAPEMQSPNHLAIPDFEPYQVSARHCVIESQAGRFWVRDRGSRLGTIVNGVRLGERFGVMTAELVPGRNELILGEPGSPHQFELRLEPTAGRPGGRKAGA